MLKHLPILDAGSPVNKSHPLAKGLVSWWMVSPFGHPSFRGGNYLFDLMGKNRGTLTNGPTWQGALGRPGGHGSLKFDGVDDYVDATTSLTEDFSFACWCERPTGGLKGWPWVIGFADGLLVNADGTLRVVFNTVGGDYSSTETIPSGQISHVLVTRAGTAATTYLNGKSVATGVVSATSWTGAYTRFGQRGDGAEYYAGSLDGLARWSRALSASEVFQFYEEQLRGCPNLLNIRSRTSWFLNAAGGTFTASGTPSVGAATASGSASHTTPTYTASGTPSVGAATAAGSGQVPLYTASGTPSAGAATASGSASHVTPTYTASGAPSAGAATASGSATHTVPIYNGTGAPSAGPATCAGSSQFTPPVFAATAAVSAGPSTASGSVAFTAPVYTGTGSPSIGAATAAGTAIHVTPTYTGTAAPNVAPSSCSGSASHTVPTYTGMASLNVGPATCVGVVASDAAERYKGSKKRPEGSRTLP